MLQLAGDLRLFDKPLREFGRPCMFRQQHLAGDFAVKLLVAGLQDDPHPAAGDFADELVAAVARPRGVVASWPGGNARDDGGVIVARTDPNVPKHKGLTYFWVDMKAPGVTVRPIKLAGGDSHVNEVFFDDVKIGDDHRMSPVGGGFAVAMATLMIERYVATDSAGFGPHLDLFIDLAKTTEINGKPERIKVLKTELAEGSGAPGTVLDDRLAIACGTGAVRPLRLQRAGGKPLDLPDFLRGTSLPVGMRVG